MTVDYTPIVFDTLELAKVPVTLVGEEYLLYEATEGQVVSWRNHHLKSTRMADGKVIGMDGMADSEPLLVSLCLRKVTKNGEVPVSIVTIKNWPVAVVSCLFERAKQISGLNEEENEDMLVKRINELTKKLEEVRGKNSKNSPESTTTT